MKQLFLSIIITTLFLGMALPVCQVSAKPDLLSNMEKVAVSSGYSEKTSIYDYISVAIKTVLGLLGTIFVILIIYAGFLWMTAGGKQDQVTKATGIIKNSVIGLIIIVAAYAISVFIINALVGSTGFEGAG